MVPYTESNTSNSYGLFPPTEMDIDSTPCTEGFPDIYIVLCRHFSTGTDLDSDPCTEIFPDGYCTHFGTDLRSKDPNLNPSPLVEMSHYLQGGDIPPGIHPGHVQISLQLLELLLHRRVLFFEIIGCFLCVA